MIAARYRQWDSLDVVRGGVSGNFGADNSVGQTVHRRVRKSFSTTEFPIHPRPQTKSNDQVDIEDKLIPTQQGDFKQFDIRERETFTHETELLQQWEGTVIEIRHDEFVGALIDLTSFDHPNEQAVFDSAEVADSDLPLLAVGAVFYWSVGYRREHTGQKLLMSSIRFRRLPAWSKRDVERAEIEAAKFNRFFRDDSSNGAESR